MFFGVSGPAMTGKSTFIGDLTPELAAFAAQKGLNLIIQSERIRKVFKENYGDRYASLDALLAVEPLAINRDLARLFVLDAYQERSPEDLVVADRTGIDVLVYTSIDLLRGFRDAQLEEEIFTGLKNAFRRIDRTFMTSELPEAAVSDEFRSKIYKQPENRRLECNWFTMLGGMFQKTVWLPSCRAERVDTAMATIRGMYG